MAIRQKTIEYAWPTDAISVVGDLSSSFTSSTIVVSIPESGSRNFKSVWMELSARDSQPLSTARAVAAFWYNDIKIAGITQRYFGRNNGGPTDTGEHYLWSYCEDLTDFFSASFTGSAHSMSYTFWYSGSGGTNNPNFTNVTNKLYITYEYNDVQNRQIKTIHIPIEYTGSISTNIMQPVPNIQNMGQIPVLNSFCPEISKSFKQIFITIEGTDKENVTGTNLTKLSASVDNGTITNIGMYENALGSQTMTNAVYNISGIDTSTTHSLWLGITDKASTDMQHVVATLHATYEYDHNSSTRVINSVQLGFTHPGFTQMLDGTNIEGINYFKFYVPESNVVLKQSGIIHCYSNTAAATRLRFVCHNSASATIGGYSKINNGTLGYALNGFRIDSGSIFYPTTSSLTLTSGLNILRSSTVGVTSGFRTTPPISYYIINYESDKHTLGDNVHNKTIKRLQFSGSIFNSNYYITKLSDIRDNSIPENDFYINYIGWMHSRFGAMLGTRTLIRNAPLGSDIDYIDPTILIDSKTEDSVYNYSFGGELTHYNILQSDQSGLFRRYPGQATSSYDESAYNFQSTRSFNIHQASNRIASWDVITYHSITYPLTGSISSYSGNGADILVGLHDAATGKVLKYTTSSLGGAYTMSWYDRSQPVYVEAYQDNTHTGRSVNSTL